MMWGMGVRACKVAPMPRFARSLRTPHRRHPWKSQSSCGSIVCLEASGSHRNMGAPGLI